jgi:hypothetical protein
MTSEEPGTTMYQGYGDPSQEYRPSMYPPSSLPPKNKSLCLRISIVFVSLLLVAECVFVSLYLLSLNNIRDSPEFVLVVVLHIACVVGALTNAVALCCKAHRVLKFTQYTFVLYGLLYLILLFVALYTGKNDSSYFEITILIFVGCVLIGFRGYYMTRKYLQLHSNGAYTAQFASETTSRSLEISTT